TPLNNCTIVLNSAITIPASASPLRVQGPGTISGGDVDRVFVLPATNSLTISKVTISDGYVVSAAPAKGGCIAADGALYLYDATVQNCAVHSDEAYGGGIYANRLYMTRSVVTGNIASSPQLVRGGGIAAGSMSLFRSTISGNIASIVGSSGTAY